MVHLSQRLEKVFPGMLMKTAKEGGLVGVHPVHGPPGTPLVYILLPTGPGVNLAKPHGHCQDL